MGIFKDDKHIKLEVKRRVALRIRILKALKNFSIIIASIFNFLMAVSMFFGANALMFIFLINLYFLIRTWKRRDE